MRKIVTSFAATSLVTMLGSTVATALPLTKFEENISLPNGAAIKINVSLSEDLAHRANALPKNMRDRGGAATRRDSFRGNGFYGDKDLTRLTTRLSDKLSEGLADNDVTINDNAAYTLDITLEDARPNRPTIRQLSVSPNLSHHSRALGGAKIEGELRDSAGNVLGTVQYGRYESFIGDTLGHNTWEDAERTINRFAKQLASSIR